MWLRSCEILNFELKDEGRHERGRQKYTELRTAKVAATRTNYLNELWYRLGHRDNTVELHGGHTCRNLGLRELV